MIVGPLRRPVASVGEWFVHVHIPLLLRPSWRICPFCLKDADIFPDAVRNYG